MKRIISLALAAVMVLGTAITSSAVEETDKVLQKAITTAKQRVDIPEEYTDFSFYQNNSYGEKNYQLHWSTPSGKNLNINVRDDIILSYYCYDGDYDSSSNNAHFAKLEDQHIIKKAKAHLQQLNPTIYKNIKIDENSLSMYISGQNASLSLNRYVNGIKVSGNSGRITVNKDTGELISFNINWTSNASFKSSKTALSQSDIQAKYSKLVGIKPVYRVNYSDDGKKTTASLVYIPVSEDKLNAFTGEITTFFQNNGMYDDVEDDMDTTADAEATDGAGASDNGSKTVTLTPQEIKAIDKENELITAKEAVAILVNDEYNAFTKEQTLNSSSLYYSKDTEIYVWNLYFSDDNSSGSAQINAETSEIISFHTYNYNSKNDRITEIDEQLADSNVELALKKYAGKKFGEYKLTESQLNTYTDYGTKIAYQTGKRYTYQRYVNDIFVEGDYISISVDAACKVNQYNINYSKVDFPTITGMLTEKQALKKLYAAQELALTYYTKYEYKNNTRTVKTALLYEMKSFQLDAFTGKLSNYYTLTTSNNGYTDLEKHEIKEIAEKLYKNGISLSTDNGKLNPDKAITEAEFINLVNTISTDNRDFYPLYLKGFYMPTLNKTYADKISLQDAVKCMITGLGGKKFAELGVFSAPFKDVSKTNKYAGYFTFAKSFGIVNANSDGNIKPKATLTKAEALRMVYNYLVYNGKQI